MYLCKYLAATDDTAGPTESMSYFPWGFAINRVPHARPEIENFSSKGSIHGPEISPYRWQFTSVLPISSLDCLRWVSGTGWGPR